MIFLLCFLTILNLGRCLDQVPSRLEIETSINRTIDEVERLIKTEPSLPRLSRSQIVDILHNITSTDMDSYEESIQKARTDYKKALMVVLPYNSKDSQSDDLIDLYTKAPMVQVIHDSEIMLPFASIQEELIDRNSASEELTQDNLINKNYSNEVNNQFQSFNNNEYKNHQSFQSEYPEKFSFNLENFDSINSKSSTVKPKLDIVYSTSILDDSTTAKSINKIQTTRRSIDESFRPTMPTTVSTNILSSDQWTYYAPPVTSKAVTTTTPSIPTIRMTTTRRPVSSSSTVSAAAIITTTTTTKSRRRPVTATRYFTTSSTTVSPTTTTTASTTSPTTTSEAPSTTTRRPITTSEVPLTTTRRPKPPSTTVFPMTTTKRPTTTSITITTTWLPPTTSSQLPASKKPSQIRNKPTYFVPTVISKTLDEELNFPLRKTPTTRKPQTVKFDMSSFKKIPTTTIKPEIVTFDMSNIDMIMEEKPKVPVYVTPMATAPTTKDTPQSTAKIPNIPQTMRKEVETLLATLGLHSNKENNQLKSNTLSNEINTEKDSIIQDSNNVIPNYAPSLDDAKNNSPNDSQNNVNNFTPDVQLLFKQFGLQIPAEFDDKLKTTTTTVKPTYRSTKNSYNMFKPLPTSEVKDESMKDFLAKFGLGVTETRQEKSLKKINKSSANYMHSVIDAVPNNMRDVLENIGLIGPRTLVKPRVQKTTTTTTTTTTTEIPEKLHVFKPHESFLGDEKQRDKINELLDTVKLVQEGKADVADVRKVANELLNNTKSINDDPDLLALERILNNYDDDMKKQVKRQKYQMMADSMDMASSETDMSILSAPSKDMSNTTDKNMLDILKTPTDSIGTFSDAVAVADTDAKVVTSEVNTPTTSTISTPTEGPNIDDLADSFGGSTAEPDPVLPTPKKSGLYFLVDWNSFLEVGEDGKDKVNLRFAPKVGDKSRFVPITVP